MKELTRRLLEDVYSSYSEDEDINLEEHSSFRSHEHDSAQSTRRANQLVVQYFCRDVLKKIEEYVGNKKKISKRRLQDVNAIKVIVSQGDETIEKCILALHERLAQIKTGWLMFKGKSNLRASMEDVIHIYNSRAVISLTHDLIHEMTKNETLSACYDDIRGEELTDLKQKLSKAQRDYAELRKHYDRVVSENIALHASNKETQSLGARFKGFFGGKN